MRSGRDRTHTRVSATAQGGHFGRSFPPGMHMHTGVGKNIRTPTLERSDGRRTGGGTPREIRREAFDHMHGSRMRESAHVPAPATPAAAPADASAGAAPAPPAAAPVAAPAAVPAASPPPVEAGAPARCPHCQWVCTEEARPRRTADTRAMRIMGPTAGVAQEVWGRREKGTVSMSQN